MKFELRNKKYNVDLNTDFINRGQVEAFLVSKLRETGWEYEVNYYEHNKQLRVVLYKPLDDEELEGDTWAYGTNLSDILRYKMPKYFVENTILAQFTKHGHLNVLDENWFQTEMGKFCSEYFTEPVMDAFAEWIEAVRLGKLDDWM